MWVVNLRLRCQELLLALEAQHAREQEKREISEPGTPVSPPRSPSPASSLSSLSTASTRTAVPSSRAENSLHPKPTRRPSVSSTSAISDTTVTKANPRRRHDQSTPRGSPSASRVRSSRIARTQSADQSLATIQPPSSSALIRSYFSHYFTPGRVATLSILFFILPLLSWIIRRRRRVQVPAASTTDLVRRRLLGDSIVRQLWHELVRAILDTVKMGGGGLV